MEPDLKKQSIDNMVVEASARKYGLGTLVDQVKAMAKQMEDMQAVVEKLKIIDGSIKGADGKSPVAGKDFLTEEDQQRILEGITPRKGEHYNDGIAGADGIDGIDGNHGIDGRDGIDGKDGRDGVDGRHGNDMTTEDFIERVRSLKGKDAASFSQAVGAKIDISHIRNAGTFIFNGKTYKTEELMHGGSPGTGFAGFQQPLTGAVNGINQTFTWALAPNVIVVDQGRPMQKISSDGTVNWTGTTTTILAIAPNFDVFSTS